MPFIDGRFSTQGTRKNCIVFYMPLVVKNCNPSIESIIHGIAMWHRGVRILLRWDIFSSPHQL